MNVRAQLIIALVAGLAGAFVLLNRGTRPQPSDTIAVRVSESPKAETPSPLSPVREISPTPALPLAAASSPKTNAPTPPQIRRATARGPGHSRASGSSCALRDAEREDLMEDLNEVGLSDPRNPNGYDMMLIENRLAVIEQIAPYADDFMLEHLGEAYKDLWNLTADHAPQ